MNIKVEWYTTKITEKDKREIESEVKQKILSHIAQFIKVPVEDLYVNLFDERIGYQVTGAAYMIKNNGKIEVIKELRINPGFHMEFVQL